MGHQQNTDGIEQHRKDINYESKKETYSCRSISSQVLTGKVLYTKAEKLSDIQTSNKLVFDLSGISYVEQAGDTIELYINGLKTNHVADGYTVSVANNEVTFTFDDNLVYTANDYGEIVVRR